MDRSFRATGLECEQIQWEPAVLEQYPNIAEACQEVVQRNGQTYVKFVAFAERIDPRGEGRIDLRFRGSDTRMRVSVPPNARFFVGGREIPLRDLAPQQELNLYVPSDQFVAAFFDEKAVREVQVVKIVPMEQPAQAQEQAPMRLAQAEPREELPATAGPLPWIAMLGGVLLLSGATLSLRRLRRR